MAKVYDVREIMGQVHLAVAEDIQRLGMAVLTNLVLGTPVGNPDLWQRAGAPPGYSGGHARRNWFVAFGSPEFRQIGTPGDGPGEASATQSALASGRAKLASYRFGGRRIILENNVPYIGRLDEGWSTQAPAGIVDEAVQKAIQSLPTTREELP